MILTVRLTWGVTSMCSGSASAVGVMAGSMWGLRSTMWGCLMWCRRVIWGRCCGPSMTYRDGAGYLDATLSSEVEVPQQPLVVGGGYHSCVLLGSGEVVCRGLDRGRHDIDDPDLWRVASTLHQLVPGPGGGDVVVDAVGGVVPYLRAGVGRHGVVLGRQPLRPGAFAEGGPCGAPVRVGGRRCVAHLRDRARRARTRAPLVLGTQRRRPDRRSHGARP